MTRAFLVLALIAAAFSARPFVDGAVAQEKDPVILVRLLPSVMAWFTDPDRLLREDPLPMEIYDPATQKTTEREPVTDCETLVAAQAEGYYTRTSAAMAQESVVTDICVVGLRFRTATFEATQAPKHTLHADVLDLWSAWFQLAVTANVADAVDAAVAKGVSLGAFQEPSLVSCGPRAVERKDPWTITAVNKCDGLYLSIVGEEYTASGKMRPIVLYHLNATGGSLRTGGYTVVAPHPASGVWTPIQFLER